MDTKQANISSASMALFYQAKQIKLQETLRYVKDFDAKMTALEETAKDIREGIDKLIEDLPSFEGPVAAKCSDSEHCGSSQKTSPLSSDASDGST